MSLGSALNRVLTDSSRVEPPRERLISTVRACSATYARSPKGGPAYRVTLSSGQPVSAATTSGEAPARTRAWISRGLSGCRADSLNVAWTTETYRVARPNVSDSRGHGVWPRQGIVVPGVDGGVIGFDVRGPKIALFGPRKRPIGERQARREGSYDRQS